MGEKLKRLLANLFRKKNKLLNKGTEIEENKNVKEDIIIDIDEGIKRFVLNLKEIYKQKGSIDEYTALTAINAHDYNIKMLEEDKNKLRQELLQQGNEFYAESRFTRDEINLMYLKNECSKKNSHLEWQFDNLPAKQLAFSTLEKLGEEVDESYNRYYMNIKPENIAKLASEYLKEQCMNNQMHFKIRTTEALKERKYMDTFIIYAKPEQEKNIYETLYKIYQNNPELFEDAQRNNPFCKKGKLPFVSVGREIADGVNSYNSLIASDLKDALFDTIKQYNYPPDQISSFLYSIDKDNIEKYMPSMKEHVKKYFEKDEKYIDKSIIEELGVNKKNNNAIEIETPWYEKNGKNQRTLSLVRPQGKSLALIETSSEIEGLKRYGLQYKDSKGKIEKVIIAYSEGINFDLMINDNEYFEAVNNILLDEKRLNTKQLEAKRYGMLPNILYIGTIGADKEGNLTKMAEKDTKKIYGKIKRKSESDHINENKEEREKD